MALCCASWWPSWPDTSSASWAQHLVLLYLTGAAILLFFYRVLLYKKPEQRRKEKAQKQEQRRWKQHRCFPISGRARAAYLILCIEEVLRYYRLDFTRWKRLLEILWDITQTDNVWEWVAYTSNLDPETIASCQDWCGIGRKSRRLGGASPGSVPHSYEEELLLYYGRNTRALPHPCGYHSAPASGLSGKRRHGGLVTGGNTELTIQRDVLHPQAEIVARIQWDSRFPQTRQALAFLLNPKGQALGIPFQWPSPIRSHLTNTGAVKS